MGVQGGPYVIRDSSLVLELDAADKNSYVTSSTTWYNLCDTIITSTGPVYTGSITGILTDTGSTIVSSPTSSIPTFNNSQPYFFNFNGVKSIVALIPRHTSSYSDSLIASNTFTMECWCRPATTVNAITEATSGTSALTGQRYLIGPSHGGDVSTSTGVGLSVGTNRIVVAEHTAGNIYAPLVYTDTISSTNFSQIVITYTNKQPKAYLNGTFVRTGLTSTRTTVKLLLDWVGSYAYGSFSGSLASLKYYSKALSESEVLQNYNAQKGRFGLT